MLIPPSCSPSFYIHSHFGPSSSTRRLNRKHCFHHLTTRPFLLPPDYFLMASDASADSHTCTQVTVTSGDLITSSAIFGSSSHGELLAIADGLSQLPDNVRNISWIIDKESALQVLTNLSSLPLNKALQSPLALPLSHLLDVATSSSWPMCSTRLLVEKALGRVNSGEVPVSAPGAPTCPSRLAPWHRQWHSLDLQCVTLA